MRNIFGLFYDTSLLDAKTVQNKYYLRVSHLGIIQFLKFKSTYRKQMEDMSHYLKHYFGFYVQENFQVNNHIKNSQ